MGSQGTISDCVNDLQRGFMSSYERLEIIVDIDPRHSSEKYLNRSLYNDTPVLYRKSGPATGPLKSGAKIQAATRTPSVQGPLCGFFYANHGHVFALTCGHVVNPDSKVAVKRPLRIWKLRLGSQFRLPSRA